ncbi:TPA: hypothetical protein N0F65_001174 [Lagenidium giganteum]|uniref:polyribonucleotide nucleotidyltransferase n=1 Tax=Lagenidium giganteum TaxID=4803 RepID=A0AAV2Z031_9STRA|nr:TPA: hypothetical protein N0F65_001174 [Lagenidium giganteum]
MLTTTRRLPARIVRAHQLHHQQLVRHGLIQRPQTQARTFLGLREMLFGKKDEKTEVSVAETVDAPAAAAATIVAETAAAPVIPPVAPAKLVGSQEDTHFVVGKYARLADGGVMATCGKSMVLTTAVSMPLGRSAKDFLPLMVDYRVKYYATGKIPDTARRTEFNGNDDEILQSRIIDRVIRPLFPRGYVDDTQVIATVQSFDADNDSLILAVNSTSAALCVSDIPWNGPVGCVRVVEVDGQLIANPTAKQKELATLNIVYAANEERTLMIEAEGEQISEKRMAEALRFAHAAIRPIIDNQKQLMKEHGKPKRTYASVQVPVNVMEKAKELGLEEAHAVLGSAKQTKKERQDGEKHVYGKIISGLRAEFPDAAYEDAMFQLAAHDVFQLALRERILANDTRFDGRAADSIRTLVTETDVLPMAHGSSVFGRGDTQALCSVTLGPLDRGLKVRSAVVDHSEEVELKHAMLHYEFPPYCVNETGRVGGVNRRMVGHGALAEKAIVPVIPSTNDFPYTIRMTSETMGSDGSSSMATVCGVSMALMAAGVPVTSPVAGISVGLVTAGDPFDGKKDITNYKLITDILGTEDHYGDMDFKVAGTERGITAIQLDVKLPGVPLDILIEGIDQAKTARGQILKQMSKTIAEPRKQIKVTPTGLADLRVNISVPVSMIGSIIGTGGSNIRSLEQQSGCSVTIDRKDGLITIVGTTENIEKAKALIHEQTAQNSFFKKGDKYVMRVIEVLDFGAILESTAPTKNRGFVHITELSHNRVESIHTELKVGDEIEFACIQEGSSGKMSRKALSPAPTGAATSDATQGETDTKRSSYPKRRPRPAATGSKPHGPRASNIHRRSSSPPHRNNNSSNNNDKK